MAKHHPRATDAPELFVDPLKRRHTRLFLPRFLEQESNRPALDTPDRDNAHKILLEWADLADAGQLNHKETSLDGDFLSKIFGQALGYKGPTDTPKDYHREKIFSIPDGQIADGALGFFVFDQPKNPIVLIELKGAETDLDRDKSNGRTPVQQCWDYLNQYPEALWGIVSNYVTFRLYYKHSTPRAYEEFTVADLRDPSRFREFYCIFERGGLLGRRLGKTFVPPRALTLLETTRKREREVGDDLYKYYSDQRFALIELLIDQLKMPQDQAIAAAQRLLDRVVFMAFCEDRGLLPERLLKRTYDNVAPLARATNPRWRNFLDAFHAIDKGHKDLDLPTGYNGGLFRHDPVVDNLDLDDRWAEVFKNIGGFDFKDEVNVEVLGHLFERSITELEKLRVVGLFGKQSGKDGQPAMPKSAERKRFGIYYTPPEFTRLIVDNTLGILIQERVDPLQTAAEKVAALRALKICDPACGSGAFLIAAYDRLEEAYDDIARALRIAGDHKAAADLLAAYPDYILHDNLHGVDLSAESVEITQLALWIRSARKGKTLADLSANILCGNSLLSDPSHHPKALDWPTAFPHVFTQVVPVSSPARSPGTPGEHLSSSHPPGTPQEQPASSPSPGTPGEGRGEGQSQFANQKSQPGFDIVIGNPPWERMKLQEREFFALGAPQIASAVSAADRRKLIAAVESQNPALWQRYQAAKDTAERHLAAVRSAGQFPLTARGDVNTYMLFAELARKILAPTGRAGLLVPSGIATDDTTKHFFNDLMEKKALTALYDFENRKLVFPDVDGRFKFCVLLMGGAATESPSADFVFFAHRIEDLQEPNRHIDLTDKDLKLLNPNTRTCPIFRTRRDADLTRRVYRHVPILIDKNRKSGGNPWGITFATMFHQTNDAEHFHTADQLKSEGFKLDGNRWIRKKEIFLPLYEAKMIQAFDHRAASVRIEQGNWMRQGQPEEASLVDHQNPEFVAIPRFWLREDIVAARMQNKGGKRAAWIGFKDITSATNQRTMIASAIPWAAVTNHFPLIVTALPFRRQACLLANLNSLAYDYIARQKLGAITLNFFIVEQIPTLTPDFYEDPCIWQPNSTVEKWVSDKALRLTCTSQDMLPLAVESGIQPPITKWSEAERAELRAQLDAAFFHFYRYPREEMEYALGTFQGVTDTEKERIIHAFEVISAANHRAA